MNINDLCFVWGLINYVCELYKLGENEMKECYYLKIVL